MPFSRTSLAVLEDLPLSCNFQRKQNLVTQSCIQVWSAISGSAVDANDWSLSGGMSRGV